MFASSIAPPSPEHPAPATATLWLLGVLGFAAGAFAALGGPHEQVRSAAVALAQASSAAPAASVAASPVAVASPVARLTGVPAPAPSLAHAAPAPPSQASRPSRTRDARSTRKQLLALALLLAAAGAAWLLARQRKGHGGRAAALRGLEVIQTLRLGGRFQVALVRAPGRLLVLGLSDKGVTLLTELDEDALPAWSPAASERARAAQEAGATRAAGDALTPPGPPPDAAPAFSHGGQAAHEEAFLDTLMDRLSSATPSVIRDVLGAQRRGSAAAAPGAARGGRAHGLQRYERALAP